MKVLIVKHAPFEREGNMQTWLKRKQAEITYLDLYDAYVFPEPASFDLIILLGGPMSVNDEAEFPWLIEEKQFVRQALDEKIPILGICLGGQLIANALGSPVTLNRETEIGWHVVENITTDYELFQFPKKVEIFNWHGETFALPEGAKPLIKSEACDNQGFQYGSNVIGLQCHPEVTTDIIQEWIDHIGEQMVKGKYVQLPEQMFLGAEFKILQAQGIVEKALDFITAKPA